MFVSTEATILHADVDAFYASVEQRDDPRLRGCPVIVGAGVVLAASYEAKAYGVRTAMGGATARRLCPAAVVISPRMSAYVEASKAKECFEMWVLTLRCRLDSSRLTLNLLRHSVEVDQPPLRIQIHPYHSRDLVGRIVHIDELRVIRNQRKRTLPIPEIHQRRLTVSKHILRI